MTLISSQRDYTAEQNKLSFISFSISMCGCVNVCLQRSTLMLGLLPIALSPYTLNQDLNWTQSSLVSLLWGFPTWPPRLVTTLTGHFMWVLSIQTLVPTCEQQVLRPRSSSPDHHFISGQSPYVARLSLILISYCSSIPNSGIIGLCYVTMKNKYELCSSHA